MLAYTIRYTGGLAFYAWPFSKWGYRFLGLYLAYAAIMMSISLHIAYNYVSNIKLNKAIYNIWKSSESVKNILLISYASKNYSETKQYALKELKREPQNLYALKYLGLANLFDGSPDEGCSKLRAYDAVYNNCSQIHKEIERFCK